jgi:hypothetical protein
VLLVITASLLSGVLPPSGMPDPSPAADPAPLQSYAGQACRYWQVDHWSVQVDRASAAIVRWDGSYWFDRTDGSAAARLRNFSIDGEPVGVRQAAEAVRPLSSGLADYLQRYGEGPNGGGGVRLSPPPSTLVCPRPAP